MTQKDPRIRAQRIRRAGYAVELVILFLGAGVFLLALPGIYYGLEYWAGYADTVACDQYYDSAYCHLNIQTGWLLMELSPFIVTGFGIALIYKTAVLIAAYAGYAKENLQRKAMLPKVKQNWDYSKKKPGTCSRCGLVKEVSCHEGLGCLCEACFTEGLLQMFTK